MHACVHVILIDREGKYLMQFRDGMPGVALPLSWGFFGGSVEEGETLAQAAARELQEELEINALPDTLEFICEEVINGVRVGQFALRLTAPHEHLRLHEGAGMGFFSEEEIQRLPLSDGMRYLFTRIPLG